MSWEPVARQMGRANDGQRRVGAEPQKAVYAERLAHDLRLPLVRLVDGTGGGGSVKTLEQMGFSSGPSGPEGAWSESVRI
jgi:hypothetical protein